MAIMEGPLSKWTNVMKGWQYRWFVLDENSGLLSYYTSKEKMMRGSRRGCVRLKGAVIGIDDEDDSTFTVTVDQKTFHFQARDAEEKEKWINGLEKTILRHSQPVGFRNFENRHVPSLAHFDKKLAETDAYLQLLIDQAKQLEVKAEKCTDEDAKEKILRIQNATENMIESIKQCILLMQISKENAMASTPGAAAITDTNGSSPRAERLSGKFQDQPDTKSSRSNSSKSRDTISTNSNLELNLCENYFGVVRESTGHEITNRFTEDSEEKPEVAIEANLIDFDDGESQPESPPVTISTRRLEEDTQSEDVPMTSYSSSEDEDFFDAEEGSPSKAKRIQIPVDPENDDTDDPFTPPKLIVSEGDEFDELYDDNDEAELESLDAHGSIIKHLISQIRIGMDLTKIVLPTFILEKRSTLEMYADFLAHPDLFVAVADQPTPKDRFIQCVRWYLSAFHAGRRSPVAKKPYNPIIGETFQCYYDLPDAVPCEEKAEGGPIPWTSKENVAFIAEQVSHHPPISAFYAEHYNKRISIDGYIWTKSKFLGLSIGVHMIGQAVISVLDYDEDYTITFPNGYGRSILTVPWVELGGKVNVTCAKTGYNANIEFHTKPFYGGKKDQVTAELFAPGQKKPFCVVKGEWNGVMWAKYESGFNEKFVDTKSMPIIKKRVRPLDRQTEYESRRLWKDVTVNLKAKNIEKATEAKSFLEQRQRDEAKDRKERGVKWETKLFHEVGEHWVYDRPLVKRLDEESAALYA